MGRSPSPFFQFARSSLLFKKAREAVNRTLSSRSPPASPLALRYARSSLPTLGASRGSLARSTRSRGFSFGSLVPRAPLSKPLRACIFSRQLGRLGFARIGRLRRIKCFSALGRLGLRARSSRYAPALPHVAPFRYLPFARSSLSAVAQLPPRGLVLTAFAATETERYQLNEGCPLVWLGRLEFTTSIDIPVQPTFAPLGVYQLTSPDLYFCYCGVIFIHQRWI